MEYDRDVAARLQKSKSGGAMYIKFTLSDSVPRGKAMDAIWTATIPGLRFSAGGVVHSMTSWCEIVTSSAGILPK